MLFIASLLAVLGVGLQPHERGPVRDELPRPDALGAPESYVPSIVEWGVSIGLIAATIFLFGLAARLMPVLSRPATARRTLSR